MTPKDANSSRPDKGSRELLSLLPPAEKSKPVNYRAPKRLRTGSDYVGGHEHHFHPRLDTTKTSDWANIFKTQRKRALNKCSAISARITAGTWRQRESLVKKKDVSSVNEDNKGEAVLGAGAFGIVRIISRTKPGTGEKEQAAVKQFRRRSDKAWEKYHKESLAEFTIAQALNHHNIVRTFELIEDEKKDLFQVMEFCSGEDLQTLLLSAYKLEKQEADCFFKQLMNGLEYIHSMGVAHCDLKPGNILFTQKGILKITDFGCSECFRLAWEDKVHLITGRRGSTPFIAPEEYTDKSFDGQAADVWACAIIFALMRTGELFWITANEEDDEDYARYIRDRRLEDGFDMIEVFEPEQCRLIVYSMLDPVPSRRITSSQVLRSKWLNEIELCAAARYL